MTKLCSRCNTNPATGRALCNACRAGFRLLLPLIVNSLLKRLPTAPTAGK